MIEQDKRKAIFFIIICFGFLTVVWYSIYTPSSIPTDMPTQLKIRDGQTVIYNQLRIEYLYRYIMPDNSTKNVLMINGYGNSYPYELITGDYINLFKRYQVSIMNNQFVVLDMVD